MGIKNVYMISPAFNAASSLRFFLEEAFKERILGAGIMVMGVVLITLS